MVVRVGVMCLVDYVVVMLIISIMVSIVIV